MKTLGLIVNPVAGLGGPLALKGSDAAEAMRSALAHGALPTAPRRAAEALAIVTAGLGERLRMVAAAGDMGEATARQVGIAPDLVSGGTIGATTAASTAGAAAQIREWGADLLFFAGGDGTARDVAAAIGQRLPAIGIPAGVKMHSAVYAVDPRSAGQLALRHLRDGLPLRDLEVMDLDEDAYREGGVSARLFGFLSCPYDRMFMQGVKEGRGGGELAAADAIALEIVESLVPGRLYVLGPGTTTRAIARRLGLDKTLLGVDLLCGGRIVATDLSEAALLAATEGQGVTVIVTPIGGQGHILGRGNQQIGPALLRRIGHGGLVVVATPGKLASFESRPLRVDTGDPDLDRTLAGPIRVVTGYRAAAICMIA